MPAVKAPLHTAMPPTVHVLRPPQSRVIPPDDWALGGKFGHMAFEAGDAGRLVRLADVLRWLQSSRGLPRADALELLCDGLNAEAMGWLYWLQPMTWAVPVAPAHSFGYATAEMIAQRRVEDSQQQRQAWLERERQNNRFGTSLSFINGRIRLGYPAPTEPGLPALLKYLRGWWVVSKRPGATCDVLDDLKIRHATTLAIRLDKANALWDYGTVVNAPLSADTQSVSAEWTGERLATQRAAFEADGKPAPMVRLVALTGLDDRKIRHLIKAFKASKTDVKPQSVWPSQIIKMK